MTQLSKQMVIAFVLAAMALFVTSVNAGNYERPKLTQNQILSIIEEAIANDPNIQANVAYWQEVMEKNGSDSDNQGWKVYAFDPELTLADLGVRTDSIANRYVTLLSADCSFAGFAYEGELATVVVIALPAEYAAEDVNICGYRYKAPHNYTYLRWNDSFVTG